MQKRTFIRTLLDIFFDNSVTRTICSIVKFCNEQQYFSHNKLKFSKNLPIGKLESASLKNQFLFKVNKEISE